RPAAHRSRDAQTDPLVLDRALLQRRVRHLAFGVDRKADRDASLRVRVARQRLVVAVADLVDVRAHDPADDVLVERSLHLGLRLSPRRHPPPAPAEASPRAAPVAGAGAAAAADQPRVAEAAPAFLRTAAAATRTDQPEPAHAECLAELDPGQA